MYVGAWVVDTCEFVVERGGEVIGIRCEVWSHVIARVVRD